MFYLLGCVIVV